MNNIETKTYTRRMPTEGTFIEYDSNDILYSLMYSLATYNPEANQIYITKKAVTANKKLIYEACGFTNSAMMKRHLEKLIDKELITQDEFNYYFPQNKNEKYRIIEKEMLFYLATTRPLNAIRIYMILLDCYLWKQKEDCNFIFTNTYLLEKLGYSTTNKNASAMVSNILESFSREGIIKFEEKYDLVISPTGKEVPSPKKYLMFVATTKKEIKN